MVESKSMRKAKTYAERHEMMLEIGRADYQDYLATRGWSYIRQKVLENAEGRCECCYKPATAVHHVFYSIENLTYRSLAGLAAICDACHRQVEFQDGHKITDLQVLEQRYNNWKKQLHSKTKDWAGGKPSKNGNPQIEWYPKNKPKGRSKCRKKAALTPENQMAWLRMAVKQHGCAWAAYRCNNCGFGHLTKELNREGVYLRKFPANA